MPSTAEPRISFRKRKQGRITVSAAREPRKKGTRECRWRHRKRCVWRHVRTFEPRKKAGERNKFSTLSDSQPPGGLLDNSNTLESPCKKFNFRQRKNIEKGHRKSVASRHRQHRTRSVPNRVRAQKLTGHSYETARQTHRKPLQTAYRNTTPVSNAHTQLHDITVSASVP